MMNILENPCIKCGTSLEKGVRIVALADLISGTALVVVWSMVLNHILREPPEHIVHQPKPNSANNNGTKEAKSDSEWEIPVLITLLTFAVVQVVFGIVLFIGQSTKSITILYTWLAISALSIPNGLFIKMYEMLVVYTYSYELRCEAHAEALKKLKDNPHLCIVTTQLYPGPNWEQKGSQPKVAFYESKALALSTSSTKDRPRSIFMLRNPQSLNQTPPPLSTLRQ